MLGIHQIQAPFAAQFGPAAHADIARQAVGDINKATKDQADHQRKMQEIQARGMFQSRPQQERSPDELAEIIARLEQTGGNGMPFGGAF